MNIALLLMISPTHLVDEFFNSYNRCVISWTVIETEIKTNKNNCSDDINIIIENDFWLYNIHWTIESNNNKNCVGWWITFTQKNSPKERDIIDYILYDWGIWYYDILSTIKISDWTYKVPNGTISENNFNLCEPNIKPIQKEIVFEDTNNKLVIAKNIKNYYDVFINWTFRINSNMLYEMSINSMEKLKNIKNWTVYINWINQTLTELELEKLVLAFKNFLKIDMDKIWDKKEILSYLWYQLWIEIFYRNNIDISKARINNLY